MRISRSKSVARKQKQLGLDLRIWKCRFRCHAAKTEDTDRGTDQWDPVKGDLADLAP